MTLGHVFIVLYSEFFAEESVASFWGFIDSFVNKLENINTITSPQALYSVALEVAGDLVSSEKVQVFKIGIALRRYLNLN